MTWLPDLGAERVYRVLGARELLPAAPGAGGGTELGGTVWEIVTEETKGDYRFFKVVVEMP